MKRVLLIAAMTIGASSVFAQQNPLEDGNSPQPPIQQNTTPIVRQQVPDPDLLAATFGDVVNMPPPQFIQPGVRLTYLTTSGKILGDGELLEHKDGDIIDPSTGKRYFWAAGRDQAEMSGGGASIDFVDIAAIDNGVAAIMIKSFAFNNLHNTLHPGTRYGMATNSGMNTFWFNQQGMQQLLAGNDMKTDVRRLEYKMEDGKSYDALRITVGADRGSSVSHTYDMKTGVLLRRLVVSARSGFDRGGTSYQGTRSVQVMTLKDAQQQKLPWLGDENPAWVPQVRGLMISGQGAGMIPNAPQLPNTQIQGQAQIAAAGNGWAKLNMSTHEEGLGQGPYDNTATAVSGKGMVGSHFLPPAGLQKLQNQQVLSEDRFSKIVTQVTYVGQAPDGSPAVVLSEIANQCRYDYAYDSNTGALKRVVVSWNLDNAQYNKTFDFQPGR